MWADTLCNDIRIKRRLATHNKCNAVADSSLQTFLLLGSSSYKQNTPSMNCTFVSYLTCFHLILFQINMFWLKQMYQFPEQIFFYRKQSWNQSKACLQLLQCHRLSTMINRQWQKPIKCCKQNAYIGDLTSEIRAWAVRRVIRVRGNPRSNRG